MTTKDAVGGDRCWPCAVANSLVGLLVATSPVGAALVQDEPAILAGAVAWAAAVGGVTVYRLVEHGYLPLAEPIAKATGLHERIGPGADSEDECDAK